MKHYSTAETKPDGTLVETFAANNYRITKNVRGVVSRSVKQTVGHRCPGCGRTTPLKDHGDKHDCKCGLHLEIWGNGLQCSRT